LALACSVALGADYRQAAPTVLVAVIVASGRPIVDLTPADFVVHAGDRPARVLSVAPATDPLAIAIVTDGIDLRMAPQAREAMRQIVDGGRAQSPAARVGLVAARLSGEECCDNAFPSFCQDAEDACDDWCSNFVGTFMIDSSCEPQGCAAGCSCDPPPCCAP
jgi:hypothetical protein